MKQINLINTIEKCLVDDEDYNDLLQYNWYLLQVRDLKYAITTVAEKSVLLHHILLVQKAGFEVDHKDGNGLNCQRYNLRYATRSQNHANQRKYKSKTTSKYKGVSWHTSRQRWISQINFKGQSIFLGRFLSEKEAALAYNIRAKQLFGEFANINTLE